MKKLLPIMLLPFFVFNACEDDDTADCNEAVDNHEEAVALLADINALLGTDGFTGSQEYVDLCVAVYDLAEAGLDECPESFAPYEDYTSEDFDDYRAGCAITYGEN